MTTENINEKKHNKHIHIEYKWSKERQEQILQLSFQMVRTSDSTRIQTLASKYCTCYEQSTIEERKLLIKLLAHTRDIEEGKGEYALSIAIIKELMKHEHHKKICIALMCSFVGFDNNNHNNTDNTNNNNNNKPLGSWKDMKYLFNQLQSCPLELVNIINAQIDIDMRNRANNRPCSLVAKWIPREKSKKFGWIHKHLAMNYFSFNKKKAQTCYRRVVSCLNKYIDTVQIKQCGHDWKSIDFDKVTSITMMKQRRAFLNINSIRVNNTDDDAENENENENDNNEDDRRICSDNLVDYINQVKKGEKEINGHKISMVDFVKAAISLQDNAGNTNNTNNTKNTNNTNNTNTPHERDIINETWKSNSMTTHSLKNMIAMVDTSSSMEAENSMPLYTAIGLGIRVAEKSILGKRVMTFNKNPSWINLEHCDDFVDEVSMITKSGWGMNTNFYKAMLLILEQIRLNKIPAEEVEDLVLVVLSGMQFEPLEIGIGETSCCKPYDETVKQILTKKFHEVGTEICGRGYKVPHILFWNLKNTCGFPEVSYQPNVTMFSGYSPSLLNKFAKKDTPCEDDITPWRMLMTMLNNKRYNHLEEIVE